VPSESVTTYQYTNVWKNFYNIKAILTGDCNSDGSITMADANITVNFFLAKGTITFAEENFDEEVADVNNDGEITMADANQIVNMFLSGEK
jgi:hypothetical protein